MQWSLAQILRMVVILALALSIRRQFWGESSYFDSRILFASFLAILTTGSLAAHGARGLWRRFWLGYSLFGWTYLVLVLRGGFGFTPDVYAENLANFAILGMLLGLICGLVASLSPGSGEPGRQNRSDRTP